MDGVVRMSAEERRLVCVQAEERLGLPAASIEKDFWVCWTLRELARIPELGEHLTFKGGTSLSKAWKLIDRFSEDIDLVVDRGTLGFGGEASPERAPSNAQRKKRLGGLMAACRSWVQDRLQRAVADRVSERIPGPHSVKPDPDAEDGQCLLFEYPAAFREAEAGYVRPVVKIELGARSDDWPSDSRTFMPYLAEAPRSCPTRGCHSGRWRPSEPSGRRRCSFTRRRSGPPTNPGPCAWRATTTTSGASSTEGSPRRRGPTTSCSIVLPNTDRPSSPGPG